MDNNIVKVLIVDDSVFARKVVTDIVSSSPNLSVVGVATNGREAVSLVDKLNPDVITLDVEMPELNGLDTLKIIMEKKPTPVVMLSSLTTSGAKESLLALKFGAVDVMAKPHGSHSLGLTAQKDELIGKIIAASNVDVSKLKNNDLNYKIPTKNTSSYTISKHKNSPIVIIASSTGGPRALRTLVPNLTTDAGVSYIIVQHLPEGFSGPLVEDLNTCSDLNVIEAEDGHILMPGQILFAKAGYHLAFDAASKARLTKAPPLWGVRPSADVTMLSAVEVYGSRLIGVVLTGMGRDGADGIKLIKKVGGATLAEAESSCVVYGMPRAAFETGCVDKVVPLNKMAEAVNDTIRETAMKKLKGSAA